eukprot:EG_transcript_23604
MGDTEQLDGSVSGPCPDTTPVAHSEEESEQDDSPPPAAPPFGAWLDAQVAQHGGRYLEVYRLFRIPQVSTLPALDEERAAAALTALRGEATAWEIMAQTKECMAALHAFHDLRVQGVFLYGTLRPDALSDPEPWRVSALPCPALSSCCRPPGGRQPHQDAPVPHPPNGANQSIWDILTASCFIIAPPSRVISTTGMSVVGTT